MSVNLMELTPFAEDLKKCLSENRFQDALNIFTDNRNEIDLKTNCWDLIPIIVENLNEVTQKTNKEKFKCCEKLLENVTDKSTPEEVLLEMIEQIENAKDDVAFVALVNSVTKSLLRLPEKRKHSLSWVLSAIQNYIDKIPLPKNQNLSEKDAILLDCDPLVDRISFLYKELLAFYKVLVEELRNDTTCVGRAKRVEILQGFLVRLLGNPMTSLDLECNQKAKSRARICAETLVNYVLIVSSDPFTFLEYDPKAESNEVHVPVIAIATLFYLILSENVCVEKVPKVYNPEYMLQSALRFATELLSQKEYLSVKKGLLLGHALIYNFDRGTLSHSMLDADCHRQFCIALSNVVIYNPVEEYRKYGIKLFHTYLYKFNLKGRYLLTYNILGTLTHSGILGYVITQYKEMLLELFRKNDNQFSEFFSGPKLYSILHKSCHLKDAEKTDLIDNSDRIISALNLLRFLIIRDKHNTTKVWNYVELLERQFMEPLKKGLLLSKAHFEQKIKEVKNEGGKGEKSGVSKDEPEFSVTVGGEQLGEMSDAEKIKVLYSGINAFEVMESLLGRLRECIDENRSEMA